MNKPNLLILFAAICVCLIGCQKAVDAEHADTEHSESDKPVQHLQLPDITSESDAQKVFKETTDQLRSKKKLDAPELHEIHMITYSLEKAIAYFAEHLSGERQSAAKKMAEVVEEIHLNSENNRQAETKAALDTYFQLSDAFNKK